MKPLIITIAAAGLAFTMNSCTKAPMPVPERPITAQQASRITDTTQPVVYIPNGPVTTRDTFFSK